MRVRAHGQKQYTFTLRVVSTGNMPRKKRKASAKKTTKKTAVAKRAKKTTEPTVTKRDPGCALVEIEACKSWYAREESVRKVLIVGRIAVTSVCVCVCVCVHFWW